MNHVLNSGILALVLGVGAPQAMVDPPDAVRPRLAAPQLIVVHGPALDHPVLLKDWGENARLMHGLVPFEKAETSQFVRGLMTRGVSAIDTAGRKSFEVALFWAPVATRLTARGLPMEQWPVGEADQHARFFPETGRDAALWIFVISPAGAIAHARRFTPEALSILSRNGLPTTTR